MTFVYLAYYKTFLDFFFSFSFAWHCLKFANTCNKANNSLADLVAATKNNSTGMMSWEWQTACLSKLIEMTTYENFKSAFIVNLLSKRQYLKHKRYILFIIMITLHTLSFYLITRWLFYKIKRRQSDYIWNRLTYSIVLSKIIHLFYLILYRKYEDSFVYRFARKFRTQINIWENVKTRY